MPIILDLTVVLNFAIDGVWIKFMDDFGERFREKPVSHSGLSKKSCLFKVAILCMIANEKYGITGCVSASICLKLFCVNTIN